MSGGGLADEPAGWLALRWACFRRGVLGRGWCHGLDFRGGTMEHFAATLTHRPASVDLPMQWISTGRSLPTWQGSCQFQPGV